MQGDSSLFCVCFIGVFVYSLVAVTMAEMSAFLLLLARRNVFRHLQPGGITTSDSNTVPIFSSAQLGNIKTSQYLRPHLVTPPSTVNKVPECDLHCLALGDSWSKPWHQRSLVWFLQQGEILWTKGKE